MPYRPLLAITMGDPSGIGPEIVIKSLMDERVYRDCRPLVIGVLDVFQKAAAIAGADVGFHCIEDPDNGVYVPGTIDLMDLPNVPDGSLCIGKLSAASGKAAFDAVVAAIELAKAGKVDGTVTAPLNKEALHMAGIPYAGHTEIYAAYTGTSDYAMMLACGNFRVIHVSTHVSLLEACRRVTADRVFETICLADKACKALGIANPRIGVAGLNPHSGENGLFGTEEITQIHPAIERARTVGCQVDGPVPPDTLFSKAYGGWYDIAVAMYHDQGHIPMKMVGFVWDESRKQWQSVSGVNITLGLPIIRCSVDHGTAFDLAGKGIACADSMRNAIDYAARLAAKNDGRNLL